MPKLAKTVSFRLFVLMLAAGLLCGCSADLYLDRRDTIAFRSGDAVAANKVAQMIDPWPAASTERRIATNGERTVRAIERYRTNRTTPLRTTSTSSVQYQPVLAPATNGGNP